MSLRQVKFFSFSALLLFALAARAGNPREKGRIKLGQMNVT